MLEPAIAVAVTALVMLLPLHLLNTRRLRAWAARDVAGVSFTKAFKAADKSFADLAEILKRDHAEATAALKLEHEAVLTNARQVEGDLRHEITHRDGQIIGLNEAHAEAKIWADRVLLLHDWHVGGKADPHEQGRSLVRWECLCGAVIYAPAGSF